MPERSWDELVAEGRQLLAEEADAKWRWGDLAVEVEPAASRGSRTGGYERLRRWAEEIGWLDEGLAFENLVDYRDTAAAWPAERRVRASFSAHYALRANAERFKLIRDGMTLTDARRAAGGSVAGRELRLGGSDPVLRVREALADPEVARELMADPEVRHVIDEARPSEDRAEQARRLVRDPVVARHVVQDNRARSAMARAAKEMEDESSARQRERAPGLVNLSDFYQATGELSRARQALTKALDAMRRVDLSDDERESLQEDANRARLVLDWIGSYLESGDHSFDQELDALLREEA